MKFLMRLLLLSLVLTPVALGALVWFALDEQPAAHGAPSLSQRDIERAKSVIQRYRPRQAAPGSVQNITIDERDLNLAANYLLQRFLRGSVDIRLGERIVDAAGTAHLPLIPSRPHVNIRLQLDAGGAAPRVSALRIGAIPVPGFIANWLLERLAARIFGPEDYAIIQGLEARTGVLRLGYRWEPEHLRAIATDLAAVDKTALAAHHAHLLDLQRRNSALHGSVADVLRAMFELARQRSRDIGGDPVAENRALLLILGAWASGHGTRAILPPAATEPRSFALTLRQRGDWAQHFLVSAALAAAGDSRLSNAVGTFKEMSDSRGGSGFSFADLAADRAGTRFGALATASREDALRVQRFAQDHLIEADIMPPLDKLPEGLTAAEFQRRYASADSARYQAVADDIERRIDACRLYRN